MQTFPDNAQLSGAVSGPQSNPMEFCMIRVLEKQFRNSVDALSSWLTYPGVPHGTPEWRKRYSELLAEVKLTLGKLRAARIMEMKALREATLNKGHEAGTKH